MITNFGDLIKKVQAGAKKTIVVAVAQDEDVLSSVDKAAKMGVADVILVGDKAEIEQKAKAINIDLSSYKIIHESDKVAACKKAMELVRDGEADLPMKGYVDTSVILKAILDHDMQLTTGSTITHVGLLKVPTFERMIIMSDSAMLLSPTLDQKKDMIKAAVKVAHSLDIEEPKVAILCAVEKVNAKMPCTVDAEELTKLYEQGEFANCIVKGPLALDNAISREAAIHKGIDHPVAGNADILITPDLEAGNILNKALEYFALAEKAGVIVGAKVPIVLTSRASSDEAKLNSIALGVLITQQ